VIFFFQIDLFSGSETAPSTRKTAESADKISATSGKTGTNKSDESKLPQRQTAGGRLGEVIPAPPPSPSQTQTQNVHFWSLLPL
jgi:hypothetical protein